MQIIQELNIKIGQIIRQLNLLNSDEVTRSIEKIANANIRLDKYLLDSGVLTEAQITTIYSRLTLKEPYNIDLIEYDEAVINQVPEAFVERNYLLPLRMDVVEGNEVYTVAVGDLLDYNVEAMARSLYGNNATIYYTTMAKIQSLYSLVHTKSKVSEAIHEYGKEKVVDDTSDKAMEDASVTTAPAVKLAESILKEAIASKASDIHIEPYEDIVRVRNRIDGVLYERTTFDPKLYYAVVTRFKVISGLNITERRIPQDGRFSLDFNDTTYDFRLSTLPTVHGEKIVIRILDNSAFSFSLEELGFTEEALKIVKPALRTPHGIILLTGPTGCGKSTTLYSFIRDINDVGTNIVSVEDPVEYSISGINQVQVNTKANMTFAVALRSILRQDPNVIMIGEIRDEETASIAIRSAITGHLVFSTLHTNDAPGAISRLSDMGVEPYLVADALEMVIAQRLVRRLCPECKRRVLSTPLQNQALGIDESVEIFEPKGCPACHGTGYKGRIGIHEILVIDEHLRELIVNKKSNEELYEYLETKNFKNLKAACIEAILKGVTSFQELYSITQEDFDDDNKKKTPKVITQDVEDLEIKPKRTKTTTKKTTTKTTTTRKRTTKKEE